MLVHIAQHHSFSTGYSLDPTFPWISIKIGFSTPLDLIIPKSKYYQLVGPPKSVPRNIDAALPTVCNPSNMRSRASVVTTSTSLSTFKMISPLESTFSGGKLPRRSCLSPWKSYKYRFCPFYSLISWYFILTIARAVTPPINRMEVRWTGFILACI